jgi:S1-C subfamily serine protease
MIKPAHPTTFCFGVACLSAMGLLACAAPASAQAKTSGQEKASAPAPVSAPPAASVASGGLLAQLGRELSDILLQNREGVVTIRGFRQITIGDQNTTTSNPAHDSGHFPPLPPQGFPAQTIVVPVIGSGFLAQGDIVITTAEVAEDIINPIVIMSDGKPLRVAAKSLDKKNNIAIFRVRQLEGVAELHCLQMGDSDTIQPGMLAITIGDQVGFSASGGLAFIARTGRKAQSGERLYSSLIQFQGTVGPGSSGSPLFGPTGEVIGMVIAAPDMSQGGFRGFGGREGFPGRREGGTQSGGHLGSSRFDKSGRALDFKPHKSRAQGDQTASDTPSNKQPGSVPGEPSGSAPSRSLSHQMPMMFNPFGGMSGIGFALPVNMVKTRLDELTRTTQAVAERGWMGIQAENSPRPGAVITNFFNGSPADNAGLNVGDIIIQMEGRPIRSTDDFFMQLRVSSEGQTLHLVVQRGNETRVVPVRLRARPAPGAQEKMNLRVQPKVGFLRMSCDVMIA